MREDPSTREWIKMMVPHEEAERRRQQHPTNISFLIGEEQNNGRKGVNKR